ncbi:hypothetical protein DFR33_101613 [Bradymonas sediminis]|nr:hypothetical protein DFR33_101613 [Bradymonas sediminis]
MRWMLSGIHPTAGLSSLAALVDFSRWRVFDGVLTSSVSRRNVVETGTFVTQTVLAEIQKIDQQIEELRGGRKSETALVANVEDLLSRTRALIRESSAAG